MEGVEAFLEGEWESLSKLFSCDDSDLSMHLNAEYPLNFCDSFYDASQDSSHSHSHSNIEIESSIFTPPHHFTNTFDDHSMHFPTIFHDDLVEEILQLKSQMLCNDHMGNGPQEIDDSCKEMKLKNSKKRPNKESQRNKRNSQPKKAKRAIQNDEEVNNIAQSSSSSEEEGCNNSESTGKAKSNKSPATDPQSLYARKRRERINERLRILQNLVPNGTKVDISTMLEEAVHYVKFLQLQIKLLSSDDKWMYAPIAYNGMDIGLYQKIVPNL